MYFDCHTLSWYKSAPSHTQSVENFRPLSYMKGELIYQISTSIATMRQGHSETELIISITYWESHTGVDKMKSKKFRVEGVSEGHQVQSPARSSTVTNIRSSHCFGRFLKNWRTQSPQALKTTVDILCFEVRML